MIDNISIGKRLKEWAKDKFNDNMAEFARALNVKPQQVYDYFSGKSKPGNKLQSKLQALGCDLHWLMYGETIAEVNAKYNASMESRAEQFGMGKFQYPLVSQIHAGQGSTQKKYNFDSVDSLPGPADIKFKGSLYFVVKGDSMEPRWESGDFVLASPAIKPKDGEYGIICWDGEDGALRKIFYHKNSVVLQSINSHYPPVTIAKDQVWFLAKVVSTLHK